MAVSQVRQREIVMVSFNLPSGECLVHPALVLSTDRLDEAEYGMFYAVLISSKNYHEDFTLKIEKEWLIGNDLPKESYFVTHIVSFFNVDEVDKRLNIFVKREPFKKVLGKVVNSMFDIDVEITNEIE